MNIYTKTLRWLNDYDKPNIQLLREEIVLLVNLFEDSCPL